MKRCCISFVLSMGTGCYAGLPEASCDDLQVRLADALEAELVPGGVLVVDAPHGSCEVAAGRRDLSGVDPIRSDDRFRVGSVAKSFVAVVALQLVAEDRLQLDGLVAPWVPELELPPALTIRDLLGHTSGLPDYSEDPTFWTEATAMPAYEWRDLELVGYATAQPVRFAPGESFAYSNTDYVVLAIVLERALGHSVEAAIEARILEPLALTDTSATDDAKVISGWGRETQSDPLAEVTHLVHPSAFGSGGAMVSTAADLAEFFRALDDTLLPPPTLDAMTTMRATGSSLYPGAGLGVMTRVTPLGLALGHAGRVPGYAALAVRLPDDGIAVLLVNRLSTDFDALFDDVIEP